MVSEVVQLYVSHLFILKDKNMMNLSLLLDSGKNEVYLERFINTRVDSKMEVRNAAVYWNFRKITKNFNDTVTLTSKDVTFEEGYWTFHMMAERLDFRAEPKFFGDLLQQRYQRGCGAERRLQLLRIRRQHQRRQKSGLQGHARVVSRINNMKNSILTYYSNSYQAGTKGHLLRPLRGLSVCGKVIPEGKGKGSGREQASGEGLVEDPGHVHEIQADHQETQVPKDLRKRPRGPGATGPGGHGKVRKQKQGVPPSRF